MIFYWRLFMKLTVKVLLLFLFLMMQGSAFAYYQPYNNNFSNQQQIVNEFEQRQYQEKMMRLQQEQIRQQEQMLQMQRARYQEWQNRQIKPYDPLHK